MAMFVPDKNIKSNISYGQVINQVVNEHVFPELKKRNLKGYATAGIEIFTNNKIKIYFDNEVQLMLEFKKPRFKPCCEGK